MLQVRVQEPLLHRSRRTLQVWNSLLHRNL
jgi:hypothetical protein